MEGNIYVINLEKFWYATLVLAVTTSLLIADDHSDVSIASTNAWTCLDSGERHRKRTILSGVMTVTCRNCGNGGC